MFSEKNQSNFPQLISLYVNRIISSFSARHEVQDTRIYTLNCPSSKGNHAPHPKIGRPNGKNTKSKLF